MNGINLIKAFYISWKTTRCDSCHHLIPLFMFTIHNWHGIDMCRKCFNSQYKGDPMEADYYQHFNPIQYFIFAFKENLKWLNSGEAKYDGR